MVITTSSTLEVNVVNTPSRKDDKAAKCHISILLALLFFFQFSCIATFAQEEDQSTSQVETTSSKASETSEDEEADAPVDAKTETRAEADSNEEADDESDLGDESFSKATDKESAESSEDDEGGNPDTDSTVYDRPDGKPVVALVLGGGGGRGSGHVGVLKVLEKEKIHFDMVVGTSIGSIVGGFYAAGMPVKEIEEMFLDSSLMKAFMTVSLKVRVAAAPIMITPRLIGRHPYDGLYYGNKFRKYLLKRMPQGKKKIENLPIKYAAVAVDLVSGEVVSLTRGNIGYAMQASSAVPGLRKPVEIDGHLYVDGGISENVPVAQAKKLGADVIIAVNIDEHFKKVPMDDFRHVGAVSKRIVTLQLRNLDRPMAEQACVTIHPDVTGIGLLSTDGNDAVRGIKAGEEAAKEQLPAIKKCLRDAGIEI